MKRDGAAAPGLLVLLLVSLGLGCQATLTELDSAPAEQAAVASKAPSASASEQAAFPLGTPRDRLSYSLGLDIGRDLQRQELEAETEALLRGIRDGLLGSKPLLTREETEQVRREYLAEQQVANAKALGPQAEKNLAEGEAFLRDNAKKPGVQTLPSGLQYRVITEGKGGSPGPEKNVKANYVVRAIDGTELDSTVKAGKAAVFPVQGVIPAWSEALQLMKEGAKWELFAAPHLAYGEKGVGKTIGPFQTVIFEIELLAIH